MNALEHYLSKIAAKQKAMIYISVVLLIGLLVNTLSAPMAEEQEQLISSIETLQTSIAKNKTQTLKKEIALASKALLEQSSEIEAQKEKITVLLSSLYTLKYAFFNEKEFANALDQILHASINGRLAIDYIKNVAVKNEEIAKIVKHKKRLEVSGSGGFKDIVSLINHIENLNMLVKFETISLKTNDKNVKFTLLLDVYGVGL